MNNTTITNQLNLNKSHTFWTDTTEKNIDKNILQIGQLVYCGLYGGKYGYISKIEGQQTPETIKNYSGVMSMGGNAQIHIIWEDGRTSVTPEAIVRGVQWIIRDTIDLVKLKLLEQLAPIKAENDRLKLVKKHKEDLEEQEKVKINSPYKTEKETGKYCQTHCAINVRIDLKNHFPKRKFSVTANKGSGVNSLDVRCDEEIIDEVNKVLSKWVRGSFDGMSDSYEYKITNFQKVYGGCNCIFVNKFNHGY